MTQHQPIFACVMRRPSGVKAIDVHAFLCDTDSDALRLVTALERAQGMHAADDQGGQIEGGGGRGRGGTFSYAPFKKDSMRSAVVGGGGGLFNNRRPLHNKGNVFRIWILLFSK